MSNFSLALLVSALVVSVSFIGNAQTLLTPAKPLASWDMKTQGRFVMAANTDSQGRIWIATEDGGVSSFDAKRKAWAKFPSKDNSGKDGSYVVVADQQGRVWVGTSSQGVRVWDGKEWRVYGVLDGPIGERVFDVAVAPTDGSVWIATSAGLTRYIPKTDKWRNLTRGNGLPSDQINSIAFDRLGNIIVGTQCDGLALADAANEYSKWRTVAAPRTFDTIPFGNGLGSAQINDVLVTSDNTIYAATNGGLAWSKDAGKTWSYVRGEDYADKVRGRYGGPPYARWQSKAGATLKEDYVTCLAESDGHLWLGYRQKGWDCFDLKTQNRVRGGESDYVRAILLRDGKPPLVATYGSGLIEIPVETPIEKTIAAQSSTPAANNSTTVSASLNTSFPTPVVAPSVTQLQAMLRQLALVRAEAKQKAKPKSAASISAPSSANKSAIKPIMPVVEMAPKVVALDDDWSTRGNWIDRYGRFAIQLCSMGGGGFDFHEGYQAAWWEINSYIGRNNSKNNGVKPNQSDQLRYYVTSITTDDERSLQNPVMGGRKQAEWDDHGETYPAAIDGPHVYATVKIPKGRFILSCYIFNKDGWDANNRWRDYLLEVKPTPIEYSKFAKLGMVGVDAEYIFEKAPVGAQSRVVDFRGGVWKRFLIDARDDEYWTVALKRNGSFNTILSAIAIDPIADLGGPQGPALQPPVPYKLRFKLDLNALPKTTQGTSLLMIDRLLWLRDANPIWYFKNSRLFALPLLRVLLNKDKSGDCLAARIEKNGIAPNLRHDVAQLLNDLQMFEKRDQVFFSPDRWLSFAWKIKNELGDKGEDWDWSHKTYGKDTDDMYNAFVNENQKKQIW